MATKIKKNRIYWRRQGSKSELRAYGDFRDFEDVGGKQEALIPSGLERATADSVIAEALVAKRLAELQALRRDRVLLGSHKRASLEPYVQHHIAEKSRAGCVTDGWIQEAHKKLERAVEFFGNDRDVATVTVADVQAWASWLQLRQGRFGRSSISGGTVRHYLNSLSNLYRRAAAEGFVVPGYNPVAAMIEKPKANRNEAAWLDMTAAAQVLEAARILTRRRPERALPCLYPVVATFLLTGGRESEVLGLEIGDISFDRQTVTFRPNRWRRLKTRTSHRSVPLWPQLSEIIANYLTSPYAPTGTLLFPSTRSDVEQPITDLRKGLDSVAARICGLSAIRTKVFRHTYCAARLQTLDRGHPVSLWTVAKELGHGGTSLVERVYGHLGETRHRSEVIEFRV